MWASKVQIANETGHDGLRPGMSVVRNMADPVCLSRYLSLETSITDWQGRVNMQITFITALSQILASMS